MVWGFFVFSFVGCGDFVGLGFFGGFCNIIFYKANKQKYLVFLSYMFLEDFYFFVTTSFC